MRVLIDLTGARSLAEAKRWIGDLSKAGHETWVTGIDPGDQQTLQETFSDELVVFVDALVDTGDRESFNQNEAQIRLGLVERRIDALVLTDSESAAAFSGTEAVAVFLVSDHDVSALDRVDGPARTTGLEEGLQGLEGLLRTWVDSAEPAAANLVNERLRLAMVSPWPPARSGIADYCAELVPALASHYDITVIDSTPNELRASNGQTVREQGVRDMAWFLENAHTFDRVVYQVGNSGFHAGALHAMSSAPGVVVLHDFFIGYYLWWEQAHQDLPIGHRAMLEQHGLKALRDSAHDSNHALSTYPVNQDIFRDSLAVIVHSNYTRELSGQWHGDAIKQKVHTVNFIKPSEPRVSRREARAALGIDPDDFVVCSFGYIGPYKLSDRIVAAWSQSLLRGKPSCRLIFVGENHQSDYGKNLVAGIQALAHPNQVHITGFVDQETFHRYLAAADIGIQLRAVSHGETSGAVMDAMRYGLPQIVNSNGSFAELDSSAVIKLPDHFTDEDLTLLINALYSDIGRRTDMSEAARQCIRQAHNPEQCAARYKAVIETVYELAESELAKSNFATSVQPRVKRLYLDVTATHYSRLKSGIERVALALCRELVNLDPQLGVVTPVYLTQQDGRWTHWQANRLVGEQLGVADYLLEDMPVEPQAGDTLLTLDLAPQPFYEAQQQGLFHDYRAQGIKMFGVVYDLLPVRMPTVFPPGAKERHSKWLDVISTLDGALCISAHVANDLRAWRVDAGYTDQHYSIGHFMLGADTGTFNAQGSTSKDKQTRAIRQLLKPARLTFLMVGTIEPRKAYLEVLGTFEALWRQDFDFRLIIVGREGWASLAHDDRRDIPHTVFRFKTHPEKYDRLIWIGNADDRKLEQAYAQADCLIAASYDEGFGLPIIEAAQRGIPVIARDIPVFHEVAPAGTTFFSSNELANTIIWWRKPDKTTLSPFQHTWHDSAVEVLDWLNSAVTLDGKH